MEEQPKKPPRPRKKKAHHDHHGGAWKVAYADFVTAMMALFLVLWLVSSADESTKKQLSQYFRDPGAFTTNGNGILNGAREVSKAADISKSELEDQALFHTAQVLREAFEQRPEFAKYKDQIKIQITEEGLKIDILDKAERFSFPSGSALLTDDAQAILAEIARAICGLPNPIKISGHTDRNVYPVGSTYTNWELSTDRANAARRALEVNCVPGDQIVRIIGCADTELLVPEDPFAPANRRISIVVLRTQRESQEDDNQIDDVEADTSKATAATKPSVKPMIEQRLRQAQLEINGKTVVGTPDKLPHKPVNAPAAEH